MLRFAFIRLLGAIPTLFLVSLTVFAIIRAVPGDPVTLMLGDSATPELMEATRRQLGIDQPLPLQFLYWLGNVLVGDFGMSIQNGAEVLPLILDRFSVSAIIIFIAVALAALIAVPAGLIAGWRQGSALDYGTIGVATLLMSVPSFWMGLLLLILFGLELRWLPIIGYVPFSQNAVAGVIAMILPVTTLVLVETGVIIRMARSSTIDVLRLEYITHARAKGLGDRTILWKHVFPNAFAPTWTLIGLILGSLLSAIAVVETVFTIPGLGRLIVDAIYARDYPVIQGCLLFTATVYVILNAVIDAFYPLFDPRVTA